MSWVEENTNKIILGGCLEVMKNIEDKSIDIVFADVPYSVNKAEWDNYIPIDWFYEALRITDKIMIAINNCNLHKILKFFYEYYNQTVILYNKNGMLANKFSFDNYIPIVFLGDWEYKQVQNVIPFSIKLNENIEHPCPKPLEAIIKLFNSYSNESDIILDPFSGSGTTAIACHNLKRNFICIEKDPEYHRKSVERYNKHILQERIF
jgi:site-specific DNA-methyltransferase (adenine-specific)